MPGGGREKAVLTDTKVSETGNQERWNEDLSCHYGEWAAIKTAIRVNRLTACAVISKGGTEDGVRG